MNKKESSRTRNYACIVYEESALHNWITLLEEQCVPCFVSPLHDKDINDDGTPKKPHYHVMVMFESVKTKEQAKNLFESFNGVGCEVVQSAKAYARYLCHLDSETKVVYDKKDIKALCGSDYESVISVTTDKYTCIKEMCRYCKDNDITSYSTLLDYTMEYNESWFRCLCDSASMVMKEYLKSISWTNKNIDRNTAR